MTKRAVFAETVTRLMDEDDKIVLLLGDIGVHSFRVAFAKHPKRCHNVGVCEQAMVGAAAGLAAGGYYPVISTITSFLLRRAYEFIRLDFYQQGLKGLFVGVGGRAEYAKLGPTHLCPEDAMLARNAGLSVFDPSGGDETRAHLECAIDGRRLAYIRLEETQ